MTLNGLVGIPVGQVTPASRFYCTGDRGINLAANQETKTMRLGVGCRLLRELVGYLSAHIAGAVKGFRFYHIAVDQDLEFQVARLHGKGAEHDHFIQLYIFLELYGEGYACDVVAGAATGLVRVVHICRVEAAGRGGKLVLDVHVFGIAPACAGVIIFVFLAGGNKGDRQQHCKQAQRVFCGQVHCMCFFVFNGLRFP